MLSFQPLIAQMARMKRKRGNREAAFRGILSAHMPAAISPRAALAFPYQRSSAQSAVITLFGAVAERRYHS